ncbi:acyltransferase family protein [Terriglobus roseus]|uniref:Peptidoglycan/LPS O-acetylase OafA/YrhL, contains acyltransferase and SGNH-hydrolase domains n=1 Tax=Terriglobus roseus TaxID=392734 RepID=A0A1H4QX71_9BACT|nr:acyltransferase [Terriglobus roseus]SEC24246.1 Peptidoglycan/LPS O-acetylase OafA/YrhL, contains acyltransferase and SGNH-hydrolase domains [Terriglobus roseus]
MGIPTVHESPTGPRFYRPELDVLRFLAFVMVFAVHADVASTPILKAISESGRGGVCVFFLLSSYLITELLEREDAKTHGISLRSFYIRRALRIWPLYFLALLLARLIDWHVPHLQMSNGRLLASVFLVGNWYTYFYGFPASFALVLWSVTVEEQFYLVWPSVRKFLGSRALLLVSILTFPVSYAAIFWLCMHARLERQFWVNTFVQIQFFGLGGMLALQLKGASPRWPLAGRALLFLGGLFAFFVAQYFFHHSGDMSLVRNAVPEYLLLAAGSVMLFFSVLGMARLGRATFLVYLGKVSYGLYVFHVLGLRIALRPASLLVRRMALPDWEGRIIQAALGLMITFGMAHVSYRYFEAFFLRFKERFATVKTREV